MSTRTLTSTDAFIVIDLDDAPVCTGIVRLARKILHDGAANLARSTTYGYAVLGMQRGGASAGINAVGDDRDAAVAAFVADLASWQDSPRVLLDAGKGVRADEIQSLSAADNRDGARHERGPTLLASGVVAAAATALDGGLDGRRVAVEDIGEPTAEIVRAFGVAGAEVTTAEAGSLDADADVLAIGSRPSVLAHEQVPALRCKVVVPTGPLPVTTRALAHCRARGIEVLADFVTTAGLLMAQWPPRETTDTELATLVADRVGEIVAEDIAGADGAFVASCRRAEGFLGTWVDTLPFGRPIP